MDLGGWLRSLGLKQYEATFRENAINERVLPKLTAEEGSLLATEGGRAGVGLLELRYALEDKPGPFPTLLFGLQHVLVMFTAMIASPLIIGQLLNLSPDLRSTMVTGVMLGCGVGTIISALGLGFVGARLPLVLGAYAVYVGPIVAMAKASSLAGASTAMIIGGLVLFVVSPIVGKMRMLFPPVVVGTPCDHRHHAHPHRCQHRCRRKYSLCRQSSSNHARHR